MGNCASTVATLDDSSPSKLHSDESKKLLEQLDPFTLFMVRATQRSCSIATRITSDVVRSVNDTLGWKKKGPHIWMRDPVKRDLFLIEAVKPGQKRQTIELLTKKDAALEKEVLKLAGHRKIPPPPPSEFPMSDRIVTCDSGPDVSNFFRLAKELKFSCGNTLPTPVQQWPEFHSNHAFSRIFFYGIGSVLLESAVNNVKPTADARGLVGGPAKYETTLLNNHMSILVDLSSLADLQVREGFSSYGVRIYFHKRSQEPMGIVLVDNNRSVQLALPPANPKKEYNEEWSHAKYVARQAAFTLVMVREHFMWTHIIAANALCLAHVDCLPPPHPLRRLLTVFTFRSSFVNQTALEALAPERSLMHRGSAFTYDAIREVFALSYQTCNIFEPFPQRRFSPELERMAKNGCFPFRKQGLAWYQIVERFVKDWLDHAGLSKVLKDGHTRAFYKELVDASHGQAYEIPPRLSEKTLISVVTQLIFTATAYRSLVGTVVDYTERPDGPGYRAVKDSSCTTTDLQSYLISLITTASTRIEMPYLHERFGNFFGQGENSQEWEVEVWNRFQARLRTWSGEVRQANKHRAAVGLPEFKFLDPMRFECAVSV